MADFGLDAVTVEIAPGNGPLDASPTFVDISQYVQSGGWTRGRQAIDLHDVSPAGAGSLVVDNTDGRFYPWNTSGPYSPDLTRGIPVRITVEHNTNPYPQFYGYVSEWDASFPTDGPEVAVISFVETSAQLEAKKVPSGPTGAPVGSYGFTVQTMIRDALDDTGWPAGNRDIDNGVAYVAVAFAYGKSMMQIIREAATIDQGYAFQAANGDFTFRNRTALSGLTSQATFGPDGAELTYIDVSIDRNDDVFYNEASVVGGVNLGGPAGSGPGIEEEFDEFAEDATSRSLHGPRTAEFSSPHIYDPPTALNVAEWIVGRHKDIVDHVNGLTVDPGGDPTNLWPVVASLEIHDLITVEATFPGSSVQFVDEVVIEGIAHEFTAGGAWITSYRCHPLSVLETETFWILGTHQLNGSAVIA